MKKKRLAGAGRGASGFTLVELLVVVMIIAILATVALPKYFRTVERSRLAEVTNAAAALNTAEARYFMGKSSFGGTADLDIDISSFKFFTLTVSAGASTFTGGFARGASPTPPDGVYTVTFSGDSNGGTSWSLAGVTLTYLEVWQ